MVRFFVNHPRLAATPAGQRAVLAAQRRLLLRLTRQVRTLQAARAEPRVSSHPLYESFMCIHGGEGAWDANTGNGYYGGLQMDWEFMRSYGSAELARYGTADRWPPAVQIEVAIRAHDSGRGFWPWPNTARACGLL